MRRLFCVCGVVKARGAEAVRYEILIGAALYHAFISYKKNIICEN
jgi:hypothetical protein